MGFALGLFIGLLPVMGIQIPLALFFASVCKWSKLAAVTGVWVTNPVTAPFIYAATYFIGAKILGFKQIFNLLEVHNLTTLLALFKKAPHIIWAMTVGGVVTGLPLALGGYMVSYRLILRYQENLKRKIALRRERSARKRKKQSVRPRHSVNRRR